VSDALIWGEKQTLAKIARTTRIGHLKIDCALVLCQSKKSPSGRDDHQSNHQGEQSVG
jgi:hypothetical protein